MSPSSAPETWGGEVLIQGGGQGNPSFRQLQALAHLHCHPALMRLLCDPNPTSDPQGGLTPPRVERKSELASNHSVPPEPLCHLPLPRLRTVVGRGGDETKDNHSDDDSDHFHSSCVSHTVPGILHVLTYFTPKTNPVL